MPQETLRPALRQLKNRYKLVGAEIGVYFGTNALYYLEELHIEYVFLIDPYMPYENYDPKKIGLKKNLNQVEKKAHANLCEYGRKIRWVKKKSAKAVEFIADDSLDFVYIDGNHSYESVKEDILLYYPKLKRGGLLSGHDYAIESVKKAINGFVEKHSLDLHTEVCKRRGVNSDWWIWKEGIKCLKKH